MGDIMKLLKTTSLLVMSASIASCGGEGDLRIKPAAETVPVADVVRHLKAELRRMNNRPSTQNTVSNCGDSVVIKATKATVVLSVTNEATESVDAGPQANFLGVEIGAKYGRKSVVSDSFKTTIVFKLDPETEVGEQDLSDTDHLLNAKAPIHEAIVKLENSLNQNTSIKPCLAFDKGGKLEFGFGVTKENNSSGEADLIIFALEATDNSLIKAANTITIDYVGYGQAK